MTTSKDKAGIYKTKRVLASHWRKGETFKVIKGLAQTGLRVVSDLMLSVFKLKPADVEEIKANWSIVLHTWTNVDHIGMVYSNYTTIEERMAG